MKTTILVIIAVILIVIMLALPIALYKATVEFGITNVIILEGLYIAGLFALYMFVKGIKLSKDIEKERNSRVNIWNDKCRIPNGEPIVDCEYWFNQPSGCRKYKKKYKKMKTE